MNNKIITTIVLVFLIGGVAGAASILFDFPYEPHHPPAVNDTGSTQEGIREVATANNQFSLDLYHKMSKSGDENIFYSPYSIFSALIMTYEGAAGNNAEEMRSVLHLPGIDILRPNFAAIYNKINDPGTDYILRTGNALWAQKEYPFLEQYINTVEEYYGGKAAELDFINETERSRQTINNFIEEQTAGKIEELLEEGDIDAMTRMVLTNAIYFKGDWSVQFKEEDTEKRYFHITPDETAEVPMMHMDLNNDDYEDIEFNYTKTDELQMLELPYKGQDLSMLILLPKDDLASLESNLTLDRYHEWKSGMSETELDEIYLPKFELEERYEMEEVLKDLGMLEAFTPTANFSNMDATNQIFIDDVIHQAYVNVDEEGTEAAGATAVVGRTAATIDSKVFRADRPFIFIIQEKETNSILFMGRVIDPR